MFHLLLVLSLITCSSSHYQEVLRLFSKNVEQFTESLKNVTLQKNDENMVLVPLTIYHALSLFQLGSVDETRKELSDIFGFPAKSEDDQDFHTIFALMIYLLRLSKNFTYLSTAGIFVQNNIGVNTSYSEYVKVLYDTSPEYLNFKNGETTDYINNWISQKTKGYFCKYFEKPINPATKVQLVSATHFFSGWNVEFDKSSTKKDDFRTSNSITKVDMMQLNVSTSYWDDLKYPFRILSLPCRNEDAHIYILLPRSEPTTTSFINDFNYANFISVKSLHLQSLRKREVFLKFPRLCISSNIDVGAILEVLGSSRITKFPQLDRMFHDPIKRMKLSHNTTVRINESGIAAAAVLNESGSTNDGTDVTVPSAALPNRTARTTSPRYPVEFFVNKPFAFLVYSKADDVMLLSGVVIRI